MKEGRITPSRTVVTSFNPKTTAASQLEARQKNGEDDYFEQGDWVLCVTSSGSHNHSTGNSNCSPWIGCALSNGEVQVYDQERMLPLQSYIHNGLVTDLVGDHSNPHSLIASAADGTVTLFDIRQANQPACQAQLPRAEEEALSVSMGFEGNVAAVGSNKAKVHFFDIRRNSLLGSYTQAHTNEVTRVRFQTLSSFGATTTTTSVLVSAAEDGLACVFDTSQPSEDRALTNILTVQSPIREIGFFGPQSDAIYCLTGSESLLLYHKDDAVCRKDFGPNLRQELCQQMAGASLQSSSMTDNHRTLPIEYLVDCSWDASRQELQLLAGSAHGDAGVFRVGEEGISLRNRLQGGHRGVVRAWNVFPGSSRFVTVGEDARMCEWNLVSHQFGSSMPPKAAEIITVTKDMKKRFGSGNGSYTNPRPVRPGGGKMRRPRSRMTASPY